MMAQPVKNSGQVLFSMQDISYLIDHDLNVSNVGLSTTCAGNPFQSFVTL